MSNDGLGAPDMDVIAPFPANDHSGEEVATEDTGEPQESPSVDFVITDIDRPELLIAPPHKRFERVRKVAKNLGPPVLAAALVWVGWGGAFYVGRKSVQDTQSVAPTTTTGKPNKPAPTEPEACPETPIHSLPTYPEAVAVVSQMDFVLNDIQTNRYADQIHNSARVRETVHAVFNEIGAPYNINFHIDSLPAAEGKGSKTGPPELDQTPTPLTDEDIANQSTRLLMGLARMPIKMMNLLEGFDIYLTKDLENQDGNWGGMFYSSTKEGKPAILISIQKGEDVVGTLFHEASHAWLWKLCGGDVYNNDDQLAALNPPSFIGYHTDQTLEELMYRRKLSITPYADTDTAEEGAELGRDLFQNGTSYSCRTGTPNAQSSPLCQESLLILSRFQYHDKDIAAYIKFITDYPDDLPYPAGDARGALSDLQRIPLKTRPVPATHIRRS